MKDLIKNSSLLNGSNLAYIGDAYYELQIRKYLLSIGITKSKELKDANILYVSAHAHQLIVDTLINEFSEAENIIFKRGRNGASSNYRKNLDYGEYGNSSGFEAVIGFHYLNNNQERLDYLIKRAISIINGE